MIEHRSGYRRLIAVLVPMLLISPSAGAFGPQEAAESYAIGTRHSIESSILGETRHFSVYLPPSYEGSAQAYPLLVVLDGEDFFHFMTGTCEYYAKLGRIPELIVVGIDSGDRWRDYTPTRADIPDGTPLPTSGGGEKFHAFLERELVPFIQKHFRVTPFHVLCGHSVAGLFTIHSMLAHPEGFAAFIATSPSLWWDGELMARRVGEGSRAETVPDQADSPKRYLFMTMGSEGETMLEPAENFVRALESRTSAIAGDSREITDEGTAAGVGEAAGADTTAREGAAAGAAGGIVWKFEHLGGVDHQAMPVKAFAAGLEFIFSDWRMPPETLERGLAAVAAYYENLSEKYRDRIEIPERTLNRLGYMEMNTGKIDEALKIFRLNVEKYPRSANAYDSLAEAYMKKGDTVKAIENYERSLELNPRSENARRMLRELKK